MLGGCKPRGGHAISTSASTVEAPALVSRAIDACVGQKIANVAYARGKHNQLDLYLPQTPREQPMPWVMWIHGGGWSGGSRESVALFALRQACRGYAVATVDYRLSREAVFPAQVADVRAALRFLKAKADDFNLSPSNVVLWGSSAGGHLAALVGLTHDQRRLPNFDRSDDPFVKVSTAVRGVIDWWGPSSFVPFDADFGSTCPQRKCHTCAQSPESKLIGCEVRKCGARARAASPITYVTSSAPPFLIQHGDSDCTVPWPQSQRLAEALLKVNVPVELTLVPRGRHGDAAWVRPEVKAAVDDFIDNAVPRPEVCGLPP
ncbi:MAG: alpha/beta hydrolase [Deltaproteobacteria bacterium]|nr:alpha/beta hydrolase [Deltaproteobacteria bacterium]